MLRRFSRPALSLPPDALRGAAGALIGLAITGLVATLLLGDAAQVPALIAPMGASAVLLFAVPASPLAQPWPVLGGNVVSALAGVAVCKVLGPSAMAAAVAVGSAIAVMALLRCLHPPGGAVALTAVLGGPAVTMLGFGFALAPVLLDSLLLAMAAIAFHRLTGHSYPHRAHPTLHPHPPAQPIRLNDDDFEDVLADYGERLDISRSDLKELFIELAGRAEARQRATAAKARSRGAMRLLSRDVRKVVAEEGLEPPTRGL